MLKTIVIATTIVACTVSVALAQEKQKAAIGVPDGLQVLKANRAPQATGVEWCASKGGAVQVIMSTCKVRTPDGGGRSCSAGCFVDGKRIDGNPVGGEKL